MRNSRRHLPYAVSTVLGLAAPALAAMFLTASTPGLAAVVAPAPLAADAAANFEGLPYGPVVFPGHAPVVRPAVAKPVAKPVVRAKAAAKPTTTRVVRRTTTTTRTVVAQPKPAPTPAAKPAPKPTTQPTGTNDYPYKSQSDYYAVDKWGFTQRQCVSFAAWRLAQHGHTINNKDDWGSAYSWDDAARRLGHTVTSKARIGAIAQWNANESGAYYSKGSSTANGKFTAGGYGHVAWVMKVYSDGSALVEQYNMGGSRSYSTMRVKAPRYLVF